MNMQKKNWMSEKFFGNNGRENEWMNAKTTTNSIDNDKKRTIQMKKKIESKQETQSFYCEDKASNTSKKNTDRKNKIQATKKRKNVFKWKKN